MNTERIGVIGVGKLGLSFALLAEHSGYEVVGCDLRDSYVQSLVLGTYKTSEPYINEWLPHTANFSCSTITREVVQKCDILFCFVATPSLPDGSYDHSAIDRVVNDLQELYVKGQDMSEKVLVIGCTTMPGYCDSVQSRLETTGISVVYNPEFIAQGNIIDGLRYADMVLIGSEHKVATEVIMGVYRKLMPSAPNWNIMSRTAAEITKISINCFLTMKIAYANMIGEIAIASGIGTETNIILNAIGSDTRIGTKYLGYGFGYGGPCLPRDMRALGIHAGRVNLPKTLQVTIDDMNDYHHKFLLYNFMRENWNRDIPFLFTQLTYKKGVEMLEQSQQYRLCKDLLQHGYRIHIQESDSVIEQVKRDLPAYVNMITYGNIDNNYYEINL